MIELFANGDTSETFKNCIQKLKNEISNLTDEKILNSDFERWVEYFVGKYQVDPITLYMDNVYKDLNETKIQQVNSWRVEYEPAYYMIDGYKITFHIPFNGDDGLLYLQPSSRFLARFHIDSILKPTTERMGIIDFSLEFLKDELQKKENLNEFMDSFFKTKFKNYIETINNINKEVEQFNISLESNVRGLLENRKQKAKDFILLGEKLNIPLNINPNAPNTIPIHLKNKQKTVPSMPTQTPKPKEYEISDLDYNNIKNIINLACISMEKTAQTFIKFSEEELRDIILSNLNTHYQGLATGETFSKVGKTDIRIQFENKAAYIGECKIWHGEKKFTEALEQLFSYTTWRDSKTSLIIFNKDNQDFGKITNVIDYCLKNSKTCVQRIQISKNNWQCTFLKSVDSSETVSVQIVIYDLFINQK